MIIMFILGVLATSWFISINIYFFKKKIKRKKMINKNEYDLYINREDPYLKNKFENIRRNINVDK